MPHLEAELKVWEKKAKAFTSIDELRAKVNTLKNELVWTLVIQVFEKDKEVVPGLDICKSNTPLTPWHIVWILCHSIKLKISVWADLISKYWCYVWCWWNICSNSIACYHGVGLHPLSFWVIALVQFKHCRLANLQSDKVSPSIDCLFAPGLVYVCESCRFDMDVCYECVCVYYLFVIYLWEVSVCVVYVWYVSDWFDSIICQCDCFCDASKEKKIPHTGDTNSLDRCG